MKHLISKKIYKYSKIFELYQKETQYTEYDNNNDEPFWGNQAAGVLPFCVKTKKFLINLRSEFVNEPV